MSSLERKKQSDIVPDLAAEDEIRPKDPVRATAPPALVDDVDRAIIRLLQRDGRSSNTEIGRVLGLTETTIRKPSG
jgi:Lrp/AsnC family transcriptional regulator for asnA, asnC and gidA